MTLILIDSFLLGHSLSILQSCKGVQVPPFFCIATNAFKLALSEMLSKELTHLQKISDNKENFLDAAASLRNSIIEHALPKVIEDNIRASYNMLCKELDVPNINVAVRSSATTEDTATASFAGQHDTFLFQSGIDDVLLSVRKCWASVFTDRAVEYRNENKIEHRLAIMCVVVQVMVNPEVAGTAFSVELSTQFPGIHICASYGLGEAIVNGSVTGDEWLVDRKTLKVIKRVRGAKSLEYVSKGKVSGIEVRNVSAERAMKLCLSDEIVYELSEVICNVRGLYKELFDYDEIDTEFAVDRNTGKLFMLQARPVVPVSNISVKTVTDEDAKKAEVLLKGHYSLLGAATGFLKVVIDFEDLTTGRVTIQEDDILLTVKTSNYFNPFLVNLKGIVTLEGSACAHPMLIGRERKLPVVCGIPGGSLQLLQQLQKWSGLRVTIDGFRRCLFSGTLNLQNLTTAQLTNRFFCSCFLK